MMSTQIIDQLKQSSHYSEAEEVIVDFEQKPSNEKKKLVPELVKLLENGRINEFVRSRAAELLGVSAAEVARKTLLTQLHKEKSGLVRGRIALALARNFKGDEVAEAIIKQFKDEPSVVVRRIMSRALIETESSVAHKELLKLIDEPDEKIRYQVIQALGKRQITEAAPLLVERLEKDDPDNITQSTLKALAAINDPRAATIFIRYLQTDDLPVETYITLLKGLANFPKDENITQALLEAVCHPQAIVSITATDTLVKLYRRPDAGLMIATYGVRQAHPDQYGRISDALRVIGDNGAINYLKDLQNDASFSNNAQTLLEQIGGQQAVDALLSHRMGVLQKAGNRVEEFDKQALTIFNDTVNQAKRGFSISLNMSVGIYIIGFLLLVVSVVQVFNKDVSNWISFLTGTSGLGSLLAMFYVGPLERVQNAVANLVQTEIVFLGYIRQVTQISAMFEREYLNNEKFDLAELKKMLGFTERTIKETMPLVQTYTAVSFATPTESEDG
jgi:HEAT repeat protein